VCFVVLWVVVGFCVFCCFRGFGFWVFLCFWVVLRTSALFWYFGDASRCLVLV